VTAAISGFFGDVIVPFFQDAGLGPIISGLVIFIAGWAAFRMITGAGR
jgi:hypothetical protein